MSPLVVAATVIGALLLFIILATLSALAIAGYLRRKREETYSQSVLNEKPVDLARYAGQWHEIASFPTQFQKECICSTANYTVQPNNLIAVENTCTTKNGSKTARATAVSHNQNNTWLKVNFLPQWLLGNGGKNVNKWPFNVASGDYWILHVDDQYQEAVVGSPNRDFLWILSRSPTMSGGDLSRLSTLALQKGYDVGRLRSKCAESV